MRLTDRIALVGSGRRGFNMTDELDCHIYLLDGGTELALVDAGAGRKPEAVIQRIEASGAPLDRVRYLILTHLHTDHAAGSRALKDRLGLEVICARETAHILETGDEAAVHLPAARAGGLFPPDVTYPACPVDRKVDDGDTIQVGDLRLQVISTPGHCRGHISLYWEMDGRSYLAGGDCVFHGGRILAQSIPDCILTEYADSVLRLAGMQVDALLPGHGLISLSGGHGHIEQAAAVFRRLGVPPNL